MKEQEKELATLIRQRKAIQVKLDDINSEIRDVEKTIKAEEDLLIVEMSKMLFQFGMFVQRAMNCKTSGIVLSAKIVPEQKYITFCDDLAENIMSNFNKQPCYRKDSRIKTSVYKVDYIYNKLQEKYPQYFTTSDFNLI